MYEINTTETRMDEFIAGMMPIGTEGLAVKSGETIKGKSLVKLDGGEAAAYTKGDGDGKEIPYGIAAADAENGQVVVYLSGEFHGDQLELPGELTVETVKPLLRENGIYLK